MVSIDTNAVQRHRNTILDCLRDGDISIRRRALELSYALINESNVRVLIRELLAFLEVADNEFKLGMTTQISLAAERFAPNRRWHIDTFLRVLKLVCRRIIRKFTSITMLSRRVTTCERKSCHHSFGWSRIHLNCKLIRRRNCSLRYKLIFHKSP